jgi:hypothetical protein
MVLGHLVLGVTLNDDDTMRRDYIDCILTNATRP